MSKKDKKLPKRADAFEHLLLPEEIEKEMTQVERIIAHFEDGYFLKDEDLRYVQKLETVFRLVFNSKAKPQAARIIRNYYRTDRTIAYKLLNDCQEVYGDFFQASKAAMRYTQQLKYNYIHDEALKKGDLEIARLALGNIDRLYDLYNPEEDLIGNKNRKLPKVRRTSDPAALAQLHKEEKDDHE